jgi:hypothetical protein
MQQLFFSRRSIFSSAREADKTNYDYFRRSSRPTKQTISFSSAVLADENIIYIFAGCLGRGK